MKQAVFLIVGHGVDGKAPEEIHYASFREEERDAVFAGIKPVNKPYHSPTERVVDTVAIRKTALSKLNGLDRLALGMTEVPDYLT